MTTKTYWKCIGLAVAVTLGLFVAVGLLATKAQAAPPAGGFHVEPVVALDGTHSVLRFRDGERVCYVVRGDSYGGHMHVISCVVSR